MDESRQCTAKSKQSGERCKRAAIVGGTTCKLHGSGTKRAQTAAQRNVERAEAERALASLGVPRVVEPAQALLEEVHRCAGNVAWLEAELRDLDPDELFWGRKSHEHGITAEGPMDKHTDAAEIHAKYGLYLIERDRLVKASAAALKAGIQERQVRIAEAQAMQIVGVYQRALASLNLTPQQLDAGRAAIARELQALDQGA